jgi:hypothetical protein
MREASAKGARERGRIAACGTGRGWVMFVCVRAGGYRSWMRAYWGGTARQVLPARCCWASRAQG